jgi:hypothetical protein
VRDARAQPQGIIGISYEMREPGWVRAWRLVFAALVIVAVIWQYAEPGGRGVRGTINYFSFFTIQSNLIGAAVFLVGALAAPRRSLTWDLVRGGAAMYRTTTFFVYGILLAGQESSLQTTEPWVNAVLHQIFPVIVVADLLLRPLAHRLDFRLALTWTLYPLAYLVYSLVRGPIADWYPYFFLDPDRAGGYLGIAGYCVAILIGFLLFSALIVWVSNNIRLLVERHRPAAAGAGAND